ncbi:MAG: hypothetical protein DWQ36_13785 [Acidobacteria bacterium]|nr:MAG: hypothetical protein DWQ36_13785 [Acidobacteriota bacterium]
MFAAGTATADCGEDGDICPGDSPWARSDSASVRLQEEGSADFTLWEFAFGGGEDLLLNVQSKQGHELTRGSILLVSGRAMLTKDLALEKGFEIDALDVPVLMYQLVVSLLAQAVPEGPEELVASRVVDVAEVERAIRIGTQSASGGFSPPWSVEGEVESTGSSQFEYSLTFTYSIGPGETAGMHLSGSWSRRPEGSSLEDSLDIQGWSLHTIGPFSVEQEGVTIFDFGAQASSLEVRTLGELRKALAVDDASANR